MPDATTTTMHTTIMLIVDDDKVLLAMKKRGFGAGKWNGPGGKLDSSESALDGAIRECQEEVGVTPLDATERATFEFRLESIGSPWICHIFVATTYTGTPSESEEMRPQWFAFADIPYDAMWQDDVYWLPAVLAGRHLTGTFDFDANDTLLSATIREVTTP